MIRNSKIISVTVSILMFVLMPQLVFAEVQCNRQGYTVETINGIFTSDSGAKENAKAVADLLGDTYNGEPLSIKYLLNKTHSVLDLTDVAIQKTFEGVDMWDPDFIKILTDASAQVKTQKLLVVSHSQGNFYGNNFYKVVTDDGDVSKKSIGVYSVASPASYVAGEGRHLTSSTDKVIAFLVENVLPGTIAPTNDTINYKWSDDSGMGHDFAKVYLEYRPQKIVDDIKWSLDKLAVDPSRPEDTLCISPPKELSTIVKIVRPVVYVADVALVTGAVAITATKSAVVSTAVGAYHVAVNTAVWTYNTSVATAVWTYNTTVAVGSAVANTAVAVASTVYTGVTSLVNGTGNLAASNSAAVILATQTQAQTQSAQTLPPVTTPPSATLGVPLKTLSGQIPGIDPTVSVQAVATPTTASNSAKPQTLSSPPKLIFVGMFGAGFGGGGGAPPQVLGTTVVTNEVSPEPDVGSGGRGSGPGIILQAPTLSVPQCAYSIATSTDGCLLATTTVRFEWTPVAGAAHYAINKNGKYATTTEPFADIAALDFSDYTLAVSAVNTNGYAGATSTKTVSVATIPIAINEIAWMGTVASANDEWFEIKNNTAHTIDLAQWELNAKDGTPHVKLAGAILPRAYLVFERTSNTTIADVVAHQIYTGALGNAGEQLRLLYASTTLDQTPDGAWVAGYNSTTTRQTMERFSSKESGIDPANWGTNLGYIKNGTDANGNAIEGTPGARNSVSYLINKGQDITSSVILTAGDGAYVTSGTTVSASSTLTVAPGVEIKFYNDGVLRVNGTLDVQGTLANPVTFDPFSGTLSGSISLQGNSTTTIQNALIENTKGISAYGDAHLNISSANFSGNYTDVNTYGDARAFVASSTMANTLKDHAIAAYGNSQVTVASSTITNTVKNDAIGVYGSASMAVASTTIDGVVKGNGIAMYGGSTYGGTLSIASSTIENVSKNGLSLYNATSTISDTVIMNGNYSGININKGQTTITNATVSGFGDMGISVYAPATPVTITGGEVTGNTIGVSLGVTSDATIAPSVSVHGNTTNEMVSGVPVP